MTKFAMLTFSNAVEGQEDEFNRWYDEVHLTEMLALPGFVAGQRFEQAPGMPAGPARFLAVYEIETDDLGQTLGLLQEKAPTMTASPAIDQASVVMQLYRVKTDRRTV
jgi:hypothetical protein